MNIQIQFRPGMTFTHRGEHLTITRILGSTVVLKDAADHTRYLWIEQAVESLAAEAEAADTAKAIAAGRLEATDRACAVLGIPTSPESATPGDEVADDFIYDVDEYLREMFGERVDREDECPDALRPVVPLFQAPEQTPPRAA